MTATNRLNLLLSDILQTEPSTTGRIYPTSSLLKFTGEDYRPPVTAVVPPPPRRNVSSLKNHRQRQHIHQSDNQNQQQTQPLLNSSTLDDLFRALTLECEQYLSASSTPSYQNKTYGQLVVQPSTNVDSNDDDYENLHGRNLPLSNALSSSLKTSIEVLSPEKRQIVSISVSSKKSLSPLVSSSQTYPLLSTSCTTPSNVSSSICHSSEEDPMDISSTSINRKRRRRIRKQPVLPSIARSSSSDDERNEPIIEKKSNISKRSCSTDYRQHRIRSVYDNHPISLPTRRTTRRRDVSLQQYVPNSTKYYGGDTLPRSKEQFHSPLSVLLTSTQPTSDFLDSSQRRRSRLEFVKHQQYYQPSPTNHHHNNNNNIPTQRIPSYPVY